VTADCACSPQRLGSDEWALVFESGEQCRSRVNAVDAARGQSERATERRVRGQQFFAESREPLAFDPAEGGHHADAGSWNHFGRTESVLDRLAVPRFEGDNRGREEDRRSGIRHRRVKPNLTVGSRNDASVEMRVDSHLESLEMPQRDVAGICQNPADAPEHGEIGGVLVDDGGNDRSGFHG
jgi:hypothetical protein